MHHFQALAVTLIDHYGYAGLFVALVLGNVGAPVGAEILMTLAGALVATGHLPSLAGAIAVGVAAELCGQSIGYVVGRYGGRPFVLRFGRYVRFHERELDRIDGFFARWGTFAVFVCRFVPVARGVVGIPAGIARMHVGAFLGWTFVGSAIFCGGLALAGHAFGRHVDQLTPMLHRSGLVTVAAIVAAAIVVSAIVLIARARRLRRGTSRTTTL